VEFLDRISSRPLADFDEYTMVIKHGNYPMMTPDDLYWHAPIIGSPSLERVEQLREAASIWSSQGHLLAAGIAWAGTIDAGWGLLNRDTRLACVYSAIAAFRQCAEGGPAESLDSLLAFKKLLGELYRLDYLDPERRQQHRREAELVSIAFAERLVSHFSDHPQGVSFLVRGYHLSGPVTGPWTPGFPEGEVNDSGLLFDNARRLFCFRMPSAFHLLVRIGDYRAAQEICGRYPNAFTSPGLRGWRYASEGFCDGQSRSESFSKAAEAFAEDTLERGRDADGSWSSVNRDLWSPYFRSRSWMARAVIEPERSEECISAAAGCMPPLRSYSNTKVHQYHLFVRALAGVLELPHGFDQSQAIQEFESELRLLGDGEAEPAVLEFLHHAHLGLSQLRLDRCRGFTSVGRAMSALDRIPLIEKEESEAVQSAVDRRVGVILDGQSRIWIHRTLETIRDEKKLQRVLLRLFQNSVPHYAQIRHGPIEYGKDIAVVAEEGGELVLRMYQAKCGDIKKAGWNEIRPQLEEAFQVPLDSFQLPSPLRRRVGILIWNGHADPHVEPIMQGWKQDQWAAFQREYDFIHLDGITNYILTNRLVSAFRESLTEVGIDIV
jgi:hypothetical protein